MNCNINLSAQQPQNRWHYADIKFANISFQFAKAKHIFSNKRGKLTYCEIRIMHLIMDANHRDRERERGAERGEKEMKISFRA